MVEKFTSIRSSNATGHTTRSIHTSRGETLHLQPAAAVSLVRQLQEREQGRSIVDETGYPKSPKVCPHGGSCMSGPE